MTDHDRAEEMRLQLPAFVLGQLDPHERSQVEAALDADPQLREELRSIEAAGAAIVASAAPHVSAPPRLKTRVLDSINASAAASEPTPVRAIVSSRRSSMLRRRISSGWSVASGLAAACVVLAIVAFDMSQTASSQRSRADRLASEAARTPTLPVVLAGVDSHSITTSGSFAGAHGSLLRIAPNQWILVLRDVPAPGAGRSWQVWTASSSGLLQNVGQWSNGDGTQVLALRQADIDQVMVSLEPTTRPVPVPSERIVGELQV